MMIAEGATLDRLVLSVQLFFLSTSLPGLIGLLLCRRGKEVPVAAFVLGMISTLAGVCQLGWIIEGRSTVPAFYLTAGAPLLVGAVTCLLAWRVRKSPGPPK